MFTKYADAEIVEFVPLTTEEIKKTASFEHIPEDSFRTNDGYMYVKVRAISSRVNKNNDGWPVEELAGMHEPDYRSLVSKLEAEGKTSAEEKRVFTSSNLSTKGEYGFKTFAGRPVFVDHNNTNPHRARGVIVDSLLYIEPSSKKYASDDYWTKAPGNHTPETWIELLLEVDAKSFPKLAKEIKEGKINAVSMGANVDYTKCSVCDNKAVSIGDYCNHIKNKGIKHIAADGTVKHSYEDCYGVNFFEISFVFDPADVTALTTGPVIAKVAGEYTGEMVHWKVIMKDHSMLNFQAPDDKRLIYKMLADVYDYMPEDVAHMEHDNEPDEFTKVPEYIQNHEQQVADATELTTKDKSDLFDMGIKWTKVEDPKWDDDPNEPFWKEKKEAEPSEEDEDFLKKFDIKWAKVADTIAPSKIDTLRKDAQCPFDIKQCGMDESGQCNVCGYEKPPEGFDDPDISEAKRVQEKVDRIRNEDGLDQPGVAIKIDNDAPKELTNVDRLRKMKKILTKAQLRQINDQTKTK